MTFDWLTLRLAALVATALIAGGMLFFSAIFAPLVFAKLPRAQAAPFIREVFPNYYLAIAIGGVAALAAMAASPETHTVEFLVMTAVAATAILARRVLLPRANTLRARADAGDDAAKAQFGRLHRASVILNVAKFIGVLFVFVRLAA